MLNKQQKLEVSPEQLSVIEAALHTQSKILHVQAKAGGTAARQRLNEVKSLLAQIEQSRPTESGCTAFRRKTRFGLGRVFARGVANSPQ